MWDGGGPPRPSRDRTHAPHRSPLLRHADALPRARGRHLYLRGGGRCWPRSAPPADGRALWRLRELRVHPVGGVAVGVGLPSTRFPHPLCRTLQRPLDARQLPLRVPLGRSGRLAAVVDLPPRRLHGGGRTLDARARGATAALGHRESDEHLHLLPDPHALRVEPLRHGHRCCADRWRRSEPLAPELLDGDSPTLPLHGLRRLVRALRLRRGGAHHRTHG